MLNSSIDFYSSKTGLAGIVVEKNYNRVSKPVIVFDWIRIMNR